MSNMRLDTCKYLANVGGSKKDLAILNIIVAFLSPRTDETSRFLPHLFQFIIRRIQLLAKNAYGLRLCLSSYISSALTGRTSVVFESGAFYENLSRKFKVG
jgi:hypothetical protein